jgi:cytosine deaminase
VAVITCPIANLYLQGRDRPSATPRGLTALPALLAAGAVVAGGGDNLQDCFIPVGRADPLLTAQYLVVGGQLTPTAALKLVSGAARRVMGLAPIEIAEGFPADLVAVRAASTGAAVATAASERIVFRNGEPVRRTRVTLEAVGAAEPRPAG